MRVLVAMNPGAGTIEGDAAGAARARIVDAFQARGVAATIVVGPTARLVERLREAVAPGCGQPPGFDAIVAAGGDGTVNAVAGILAGGELPLGIVPLGTLNHFARDLGLPLDIEAAVGVIAEGSIRRVDVGEVNGRVFVNTSSLGIYPLLAAERYRERRRGLSTWTAMTRAVLRVLWRLPTPRVRVAAPGWAAALRTPCLFVGNNTYDLSAFPIAERVRLDGGELCLYAVERKSWPALLRLGWRLVLGRLEPGRDLIAACGPEFEVTARRRRLRVALDGNSHVLTTPLRYRARPAALPVLVSSHDRDAA
jgi:diacylglycerol kinase family enzyme